LGGNAFPEQYLNGETKMASLDYEEEKSNFRSFYDSRFSDLDAACSSYISLIKSLLSSDTSISISNIEGRVKNREEAINKFKLKYRTDLETKRTPYTIRENISDLIGLRVVCLYEDEIGKIQDLIVSQFTLLDITDKIASLEKTEGSFGYKGLHLDLELSDDRGNMLEYTVHKEFPFELQIRTVVQDSWSIVDHKIKYKKSIPNNLKRRINTLAALFELADREFRAIRDETIAEIEGGANYQDIDAEFVQAQGDNGEGSEQATVRQIYNPLDAFNFLRIAQHFFPNDNFEPHKVDGFTQEIINITGGITRGKFNFYLRETITKVKLYKSHFEENSDSDQMNPFTIMRHCLFFADKDLFQSMLTDTARANFESWLST
jgi:GTP pyrophosphokinase